MASALGTFAGALADALLQFFFGHVCQIPSPKLVIPNSRKIPGFPFRLDIRARPSHLLGLSHCFDLRDGA
jgi:hypothetical protein